MRAIPSNLRMEIPGGTKIRCPICSEETVLKRNKKDSPYWTCTTLMTTVNAHSPMADEFMQEFVVDEDGRENEVEPEEVATLDGENTDVGQDSESAFEESSGETTIEELLSEQ